MNRSVQNKAITFGMNDRCLHRDPLVGVEWEQGVRGADSAAQVESGSKVGVAVTPPRTNLARRR